MTFPAQKSLYPSYSPPLGGIGNTEYAFRRKKIIQIIAAIFAQYPVSDNLTHQSKVSFQQFFLNYKVKLKVNTSNNILTVTFLG